MSTLAHLRAGRGEPLVLIHSLGGSNLMWRPVLERLAEHREVIAVDMPGFGASPSLAGRTEPSPRNLARAVIDFCDTLALRSDPHLAGISLGSWVSIECARLGRARSVTGLCSAGFWREPLGPRRNTARAAARLLSPLAPLLLGGERIRRAALGNQIRHPERLSRSEAVGLVHGYARSSAYPRANELMRAGVVGPVDDLEVPLTLAWAEFDNVVRRTPIRALEGSARQVSLPDCGHIPTWDDPELVSRVILEGSGLTPVTWGASAAQ